VISPTARNLVGLACLLALSLAACSDPSDPERKPLIQLVADSATVAVGESFEVGPLPLLPPGYVPPVDWSSSNPGVASVASTGRTTARVTGIQPGVAVIHAMGEGARDSLHVRVTAPSGASFP